MRIIYEAKATIRACESVGKLVKEIDDACLGCGADTILSALIAQLATQCMREQIDPKGILSAIKRASNGSSPFFTTIEKELLESRKRNNEDKT